MSQAAYRRPQSAHSHSAPPHGHKPQPVQAQPPARSVPLSQPQQPPSRQQPQPQPPAHYRKPAPVTRTQHPQRVYHQPAPAMQQPQAQPAPQQHELEQYYEDDQQYEQAGYDDQQHYADHDQHQQQHQYYDEQGNPIIDDQQQDDQEHYYDEHAQYADQQQQQYDENGQYLDYGDDQQQYAETVDGTQHEGGEHGAVYEDDVVLDDIAASPQPPQSSHEPLSNDDISRQLDSVAESELEPEDSQRRRMSHKPAESPTLQASSLPNTHHTLGSLIKQSPALQTHNEVMSPASPALLPVSANTPHREEFIRLIDNWRVRLQLCPPHSSSTLTESLSLIDSLKAHYTALSNNASSDDSMIASLVGRLSNDRLLPLLSHCLSQCVDHLSVALAAVGYYANQNSHLSLAPNLSDSRSMALRLALISKSTALTAQSQIYLPSRLSSDIESLAFMLRLPVQNFHLLPLIVRQGNKSQSNNANDCVQTIDTKYLSSLLTKHSREKKVPSALLLTLGTSGCQGGIWQYDDVEELLDIAQRFHMWVHAEGTQVIQCGEPRNDDSENGTDFSAQYEEFVAINRELKDQSLAFLAARVHSFALDLSDYFTLPSSLTVTLVPNMDASGLSAEQIPHSHAMLASLNSQSLLTLWSTLISHSSQSFQSLVDLFPLLQQYNYQHTSSIMQALQSFDGSQLSYHLSPIENDSMPQSVAMLLTFSLTHSTHSHYYPHLSESHVQSVIEDLLHRQCSETSDDQLSSYLLSKHLIPLINNDREHRGFLVNSTIKLPIIDENARDSIQSLTHFLASVSDCLALIDAVGSKQSAMHKLLDSQPDFQYIPQSSLSSNDRPGFSAFRFTPASIPESFHDDLTVSLTQALTAISPSLYRGASTIDSNQCCIVELCHTVRDKGCLAIINEIVKQSKRLRLPANVEQHLANELKARITETESQLKTNQQPSGIRAIPIVGSFFSLFGGSGGKTKGHSYDIKTSYPGSTDSQKPNKSPSTKSVNVPTNHTTTTSASATTSNDTAVLQTPDVFSRGASQAEFTQLQNHSQSQEFSSSQEILAETTHEHYDDDDQHQYEQEIKYPDDQQQYNDQQHYDDQQQHQYYDEQGNTIIDDQQQYEEHHQDEYEQPINEEEGEISVELRPIDDSESQYPSDPEDSAALFSQLQYRDANELVQFINDGDVLTIFFPTETGGLQAISLYLFYDMDSVSLCWCEPGQRYSVPDQTLPITAISELHLGATPSYFPPDADSGRCFSIISDLITLHCEAEDTHRRNELLLALYHLLSANGNDQDLEPQSQQTPPSVVQQPRMQQHQQQRQQLPQRLQQPQQPVHQPQQQQQQQQRRPSAGNEVHRAPQQQPASASQQQPLRPLPSKPAAGAPAKSASSASGATTSPPHPQSSVTPDSTVGRALQTLEQGTPFTVFLVDRSKPSVTTRHSVVLWWIPDSNLSKGRLCWSRRLPSQSLADTRLEYHPSRSLLLNGSVEILLGKQSKPFLNTGVEDVANDRCVTISVDRTNLNLAAESQQSRDQWLDALHTIMTHAGSKKVIAK